MATQQIALSNVINVSILPTPSNLGVPNINTAALFVRDAVPGGWAPGQTFAVYVNATDVATDFGSNSNPAAIATAFFAQNPNPVGTSGYLVVIPRESGGTELVRDAIARTQDEVFYFGILIDEEMSGDAVEFAALTAYVQSIDKMFFYTSSSVADLNPGSILDDVRTASENHTRCFYYGSPLLNGAAVQQTQIFSGAYAGRGLSTNFSGSNTATTMHLKTLATIEHDQTIAQTQIVLAQAAGVDVYVSIATAPGLFTSGTNQYYDQVYNRLALKFALQVAGFNYLAGTNTKIPQTEQGITGLKNAYRAVCTQFVSNGYAGPGTWTSPDTFGNQEALLASIEGIGYYVYSAPLSQQPVADRNLRKAPLIQIAIKEQGAVHSSNVIVNVNP